MDKETKNLIAEVSAGIVFFTMAAMLAALFVYPQASVFAGLILGMVLALVMFFSMALVLDRSMKTMDPRTVQKWGIISASVRYLLLIAILITVISMFSDRINPVALVTGVLGLKVGAFLQPVIHKIAFNKNKKV
ncbi:ATP synthase subunit I [Clostridium boliviensis]|uniref:ATP synthase subunit I n=1 Tax=Clostridium boliviensis TaxID=318465 RepID=A0ABU4GTF0_9CLOT|nr:ATP synthase subunit I [Clostridium boliviensis]MDW2800235.1 ATP synthase subunit I [Clostridium boliviensis]